MEEVAFVLGPVTSLLVWRAAMTGAIAKPEKADRQPDLARCRASIRVLQKHPRVLELGSVPLDVMVGEAKAVHRQRFLNTIVLKGSLPEGSFWVLDEGLYVCAPELCFALLGRGGSVIHLAEVGLELCGTYAMAHDQSGQYSNCPQRTDVGKLTTYLDLLGRRHGRRIACEALHLVGNKSDSPQETDLFLDLTLPCKYGGYDIRKPELNARLNVSERSRASLGKEFIIVDELYRDERGNPLVVGECNRTKHHVHAKRADANGFPGSLAELLSDDIRREIVRDEGLGMVTLHREDTLLFERFDAKAMRIGKLAGCEPIPSRGDLEKLREERFYALFDTKRWACEYETLRSMAGYGRAIYHRRRSSSHESS